MNFVKKTKQCVKQGIRSSSLKRETAGLSERMINFYPNTRRGVPVCSRHSSHCSANYSVTDSKHSHSGITWWPGQENFCAKRLLGPTQPSRHGYGGSFPGVKRPGREVDLWPLSIAEVEREWSCTSVPVCSFMKWTVTTSHLLRSPYRLQKYAITVQCFFSTASKSSRLCKC